MTQAQEALRELMAHYNEREQQVREYVQSLTLDQMTAECRKYGAGHVTELVGLMTRELMTADLRKIV